MWQPGTAAIRELLLHNYLLSPHCPEGGCLVQLENLCERCVYRLGRDMRVPPKSWNAWFHMNVYLRRVE